MLRLTPARRVLRAAGGSRLPSCHLLTFHSSTGCNYCQHTSRAASVSELISIRTGVFASSAAENFAVWLAHSINALLVNFSAAVLIHLQHACSIPLPQGMAPCFAAISDFSAVGQLFCWPLSLVASSGRPFAAISPRRLCLYSCSAFFSPAGGAYAGICLPSPTLKFSPATTHHTPAPLRCRASPHYALRRTAWLGLLSGGRVGI